MKPSTKEFVKMLAVSFVVMMALPVGYRVWRIWNPEPERPRQTLTQLLAETAGNNAVRLLRTPVAQWTEYDKKTEPQIFGWLEAHGKTVLPWEWTDEARRKDPDGYRKLWLGIFKEQESELNSRQKAERKQLKAIERELWIAETLFDHRTNQIARVRAYVATNAFPMAVTAERLEKGRFWGWNRTPETRKFDSHDVYVQYVAEANALAGKDVDKIGGLRTQRDEAAKRFSLYAGLAEAAHGVVGRIGAWQADTGDGEWLKALAALVKQSR